MKINPQGSVAARKIQGACQYLGQWPLKSMNLSQKGKNLKKIWKKKHYKVMGSWVHGGRGNKFVSVTSCLVTTNGFWSMYVGSWFLYQAKLLSTLVLVVSCRATNVISKHDSCILNPRCLWVDVNLKKVKIKKKYKVKKNQN